MVNHSDNCCSAAAAAVDPTRVTRACWQVAAISGALCWWPVLLFQRCQWQAPLLRLCRCLAVARWCSSAAGSQMSTQCLCARVWATKPRFFVPLWRVRLQYRFGGCNYSGWIVDWAVQGACTAWQQYSTVLVLCFDGALTVQRCTNYSIVCAGSAASCSAESSNLYALPPHQLYVWWRLASTPPPSDRVPPWPLCPLLARPHRCGLLVCSVLFCCACISAAASGGCLSYWCFTVSSVVTAQTEAFTKAAFLLASCGEWVCCTCSVRRLQGPSPCVSLLMSMVLQELRAVALGFRLLTVPPKGKLLLAAPGLCHHGCACLGSCGAPSQEGDVCRGR